MQKHIILLQHKIFLILLVAILFAPVVMQAQTNTGNTKKDRKAFEKAENQKKFEKARELILNKKYVIPVERALLKDGALVAGVRRELNYLFVDGDTAVLQFASGHAPIPGMNGLGGWTFAGEVKNLKVVDKEKKNRLFLTFTITGNWQNKISVSLNGSDQAAIDLDHPQYGRVVSMRGPVEPIGKTRVLEGTEF